MLRFILNSVGHILASSRRKANPAPHIETGLRGEEAAERFLRQAGFTIVARRWSTPRQRGDLDLVAWKDEVLVFVEVKTRTAHDRAAAELTVDRKKRDTLRKLARFFLKSFHEKPRATRFDVLSVYLLPGQPAEVKQIQSAFRWSEEQSRH